MKRLGIIGGRGMLGSDLDAAARNANWQTAIYDLPEFDITDCAQLAEAVAANDCIVNCAAYTNVDRAESEPDICAAVNATAPGELGRLIAAAGKYVIHISTDFVYGDLQDTPQKETDTVNPLSVYGKTKLDGETALLASGCRGAILRVQWTYGIHGVNFITKLAALAQGRDSLKVVNDQTGAPTATADVAGALLCMLEKQPVGVFNFAAAGYATRFETAELIVSALKMATKLSPCSSSEFPAPAARPRNSKFDCAKIDQTLDFIRPAWRDSLTAFLEQWGSQIR